jgi:hypothetical protein
MNAFVNAVKNQSARTANGMKARASTANACVDLFFKIGASRGKNIVPAFVAAYVENPEVALRIALWARDARGGAGERELFRQILKYLETNDAEAAKALLSKVPELGRWDDLLVFNTAALRNEAFDMIHSAILGGDGLCAKWMPRKGLIANALRTYLGLSPKNYRKTLVQLTNVVEQNMCAQDWDNINFSHVPSVASARYKKAFNRHTTKYAEYVASLVKGEAGVKVNAGAVYPYDVLKGMIGSYRAVYSKTEVDLVQKQWESLPNYVGDAAILPLVDVSGSMGSAAGGYNSKSKVTCMDVAVSLGLYLSDKNRGAFKDTFLTFSSTPELLHLKGTIIQKIQQMLVSSWAMSTNLNAAFTKILTTAVDNNVAEEDMPKILLILSDMQFNQCTKYDDTAMKMIQRKYEKAGYEMPRVVFWNINAADNVPVKFDTRGTALVSGFSPAIMQSILAGDVENFTPEAVMLQAVMKDRYNFN